MADVRREVRVRVRALLSGTYIYGMDRKGRVVMPAQFRSLLGAPFVLTRAPAHRAAHVLCRSVPRQ